MTEYISREAAIVAISKKMQEYISKSVQPLGFCKYREDDLFTNAALGCRAALEEVKALPAADVRPVVRGEWVEEMVVGGFAESWESTCSICGKGYRDIGKPRYCPNCGARMEES